MDSNFLTLTNMHAQSMKDKVLGGDPYTFINIIDATLEVGLEIATFGPPVKDNLPMECAKASRVRRIKVPVPLLPSL